MRAILGVLAITVVVVGCGGPGASTSAAPGASVAASPSGAFGGSVTFKDEGSTVTTTVDGTVQDGTVTGTAITTLPAGTHTVQLACAAKDDGGWVVGGTVESTTIPGETADVWSAVIVREGSPKLIGVWLSAGPEAGDTCDAFLASIDPATIEVSNFSPIESGELVPPA